MSARSARAVVRNPILGLPSWSMLADLPPDSRRALRAVLAAISTDANDRAQKCWKQSKAPMAAYWKATSVYAKHIRRAVPS